MQKSASPYKNPYRNPNQTARAGGSGASWLYGSVLGFITLFFLIAPYNRALFQTTRREYSPEYSLGFYYPVYIAMLCAFAGLLLVAVYAWRAWRPQGWKAYTLLYVWLIPVMYGTAVLHAASPYLALQSFYLQLMYAAFFVCGAAAMEKKLGAEWVAHSLLGAGYAVIVYGFVYWFGNMPDTKGILIEDRLTSVFTYANAYAAYLIALIFSAAYLSVTATRGYVRFLHALFLLPAILALLLTYSRGGLVFIPIVLLAVMPFLRLAKQASLLVHLAVGTIAAFALSSYMTDTGLALRDTFELSANILAWAALAAASVAAAAVSLLLHRFLVPWLESRTGALRPAVNRLALAGAALLLLALGAAVLQIPQATALLPERLAERIASINFEQHSVLERGYFYIDAMKIVSEYPLLGAGGGGWAALYQTYQSYPYSSSQAHNYIMQTWVEIGTLGLLVVALLVAWVTWNYIRRWLKGEQGEAEPSHLIFFIIALAILGHSAIDFDMSYGYLSALVFLSLGAMAGVARYPGKSRREEAAPAASGWLRWTLPSLYVAISCVMLVFALQLVIANRTAASVTAKLKQTSVGINDIMPPLDKALRLQPSNIDILLLKTSIWYNIYQQTKDAQWLAAASDTLSEVEKREKHIREVNESRYEWTVNDKPEEALGYMKNQLAQYPWDISIYERVIQLDRALGEANPKDGHWDHALQTYSQALEQRKRIEAIPKGITILIPFEISQTMALNAAQIYYGRADYKTAADTLKPLLSEDLDNAQNRPAVRWYLAALQKQGQSDQPLMDKLLARDPAEKARIDQITQ